MSAYHSFYATNIKYCSFMHNLSFFMYRILLFLSGYQISRSQVIKYRLFMYQMSLFFIYHISLFLCTKYPALLCTWSSKYRSFKYDVANIALIIYRICLLLGIKYLLVCGLNNLPSLFLDQVSEGRGKESYLDATLRAVMLVRSCYVWNCKKKTGRKNNRGLTD